VLNDSEVVETYHLDVVGDPASWAVVEPSSVSLLPGEQAMTTITFSVPEAGRVSGGLLPWGLRARAETDRTISAVEEAELHVEGVAVLACDLLPETVRARRRSQHRVVIHNRGNCPADVALAAQDKDEVLDIRVETASLTVPPGQAREVAVRVRSHQRGRAHHAFTIDVSDADGALTVLRGALDQRPRPKAVWAILLVAAALVLTVVARAGPEVATSIRSSSEPNPPEALSSTTAAIPPAGDPSASTTLVGGPVDPQASNQQGQPATGTGGPTDPQAPDQPGQPAPGGGGPTGGSGGGAAGASPGVSPTIPAGRSTPGTPAPPTVRPPGPVVNATSRDPVAVDKINDVPQRVRVTLSWGAPSDNGGNGPTGYRIRCTLMLGSSPYGGPTGPAQPCRGGIEVGSTSGATSFAATIERVEPGPLSWIKWEVVAVNTAGAGPAAAAQVVVPNLVGLPSWQAYPFARVVGIALGGGQKSCSAPPSITCDQTLPAGNVVAGGSVMTAYEPF